MRIAVLGWGSLVWDPRELQIRGGWNKDGPFLPIEFARISRDERLTLVLYPGANAVQTLWAISANEDLNQARKNLREREGTNIEGIAYVSILDDQSNCQTVPESCEVIRQWAEENELDAIIWTDLPSNFKKETGMDFTEDNVIIYLRSLEGESLEKAEEYVRKTPPQVKTTIRGRIERELDRVRIELKKFCSACNQEKDVTEIEINPQGESVRLSCGHRIISVEVAESLGISEQIMAKHFGPEHKLKSRYKTKTSGETKRPARDNIIIDRDRRKIIHQVWEQNPNGEWELVHDEEKPALPKAN
jgi:hypothetical protein